MPKLIKKSKEHTKSLICAIFIPERTNEALFVTKCVPINSCVDHPAPSLFSLAKQTARNTRTVDQSSRLIASVQACVRKVLVSKREMARGHNYLAVQTNSKIEGTKDK